MPRKHTHSLCCRLKNTKLLVDKATWIHLNLALASIRRMVFQDLNGNDLIGASLPAFGHLSKRASAQKLQHFVATGHWAKNLVLHQLVIPFAIGAAAFSGWSRVWYGLARAAPTTTCTCGIGGGGSRELLQDLNAATAAAAAFTGLLNLSLLAVSVTPRLRGDLSVSERRWRHLLGDPPAAGSAGQTAGAVCSPHDNLTSGAGRSGREDQWGGKRWHSHGRGKVVPRLPRYGAVSFAGRHVPHVALHL